MVEVIHQWPRLKYPEMAILKMVGVTAVLFLAGLLPWIDNYAHLFGFIFGFLLSYALLPFVTFGGGGGGGGGGVSGGGGGGGSGGSSGGSVTGSSSENYDRHGICNGKIKFLFSEALFWHDKICLSGARFTNV
jgi:uncharacterized membrane protein YgcG